MGERVDCVVIGAGVVGLAVARALALSGREVMVLEQHDAFGTETSSRNSEVIHAGIYYEPGSLKARLCVRGKAMLYPYLAERGVPHLNCGKLIVATSPAEVPGLQKLMARAEENGVRDLRLLSAEEAQAMEPALSCEAAIWSPSTGVFDSHTYMLSLLGDIENAGGMAVFNAPVVGGRVREGGVEIDVGGEAAVTLDAALVVNCAGLHASKVARMIEGFPADKVPETRYAKGRYFTYSGKAPFERLIYPMPSADSQGTHYTRDLGGQGRLGPDVLWGVELGDYDVEADARDRFWQDAVKFWPGLEKDKLHASYAGIRPKITSPGVWADYRIDGPQVHGVPGMIQLFGIESPGLTASMAIGSFVASLARGSSG
ncbi:NAD(P)/FAD-dependent oxidoreductase [Aquisalinus flavus]|uniref:Dehydrogenase n=1 Tax=Aquisalinus flavus TaxID=1526572 RepID=A0A8J2V4L4_9PROT|nr:NAD(P)/FAD-dependent oxidoreductase [Aquisalinus flavus]MBD0427026.1 NAD(P)/FAD-dependent oxidoreductase [Aquisalinus flavus]UNE46852.1 NAD(P)/FAD-dependent oxidoreductase [Aquisalinus flavus]GGC97778.1 dehydrogenase [Aquisalinus flavus]